MTLKHLTKDELHQNTVSLAKKERLSTVEVLWHLREIERRMLYAEMGYRDLREYCVQELKYSEGAAWRRISAMRVLKEMPEIEDKIEAGKLNLTQLSLVRAHFREVQATPAERKEMMMNLENQDTKTTQRILAEATPGDVAPDPQVVERPLKGHRLQVTLVLDEELQNELEEIQVLIGKKMSKLDLLRYLAQDKLERLRKDQLPRTTNRQERGAQPLRFQSKARSRRVSKSTLNKLKARDQHRCQYRDPQTERQCTAKHHLQVEHIRPFAKGGTNVLSNLQLLCPTHNKLRAVQEFGAKKMQRYMPRLRTQEENRTS